MSRAARTAFEPPAWLDGSMAGIAAIILAAGFPMLQSRLESLGVSAFELIPPGIQAVEGARFSTLRS